MRMVIEVIDPDVRVFVLGHDDCEPSTIGETDGAWRTPSAQSAASVDAPDRSTQTSVRRGGDDSGTETSVPFVASAKIRDAVVRVRLDAINQFHRSTGEFEPVEGERHHGQTTARGVDQVARRQNTADRTPPRSTSCVRRRRDQQHVDAKLVLSFVNRQQHRLASRQRPRRRDDRFQVSQNRWWSSRTGRRRRRTRAAVRAECR